MVLLYLLLVFQGTWGETTEHFLSSFILHAEWKVKLGIKHSEWDTSIDNETMSEVNKQSYWNAFQSERLCCKGPLEFRVFPQN